MTDKQTCNNCACDSVCDHNWNGWETCGNWQPVLVRCEDCDNWDKDRAVGGKRYGNLTAPCSEWSHQEEGHTRYTLWNGFCSYGERREDYETD